MIRQQSDSFWPSYTDLMTSLFFIMLVLYVLTYVRLNTTIKLQKEKLAIIEAVDSSLRPLKSDPLFVYEEKYKRFKLGFDVKFENNQSQLEPGQLDDYNTTIKKIDDVGDRLKSIIDQLKMAKQKDSITLRNVSYILVIAGYASHTGEKDYNYELSYQRALALRNYWFTHNINFEDPKYQDLIDLQISGNGWGGVGRDSIDERNQRFIIQIFPKIGDIK